MKQISLLILGSLLSLPAFGREISGIVVDSSTGETLVGATVYVKQLPKLGTATLWNRGSGKPCDEGCSVATVI